MSAKPLLFLFLLVSLSPGCGDDEGSEEDATGAKVAKKSGAKSSSKGGKKANGSGGMTYQLQERSRDVQEDLAPLTAEPITTDPGSIHTGACAALIDCICNLETAMDAASPDEPRLGGCERAKTKFEGRSILDGECAERLDAQKIWVAAQDQLIADGISIPESCR
jgi:hypothetical protein